jgi:hypothetical protein
MVANYATMTQAATQLGQIAAMCELLWNIIETG